MSLLLLPAKVTTGVPAARVLAQLSIAADGTITGAITLPADLETGYHKILISYTDIADNVVERYAYFYVAHSRTDWDGDGVDNGTDVCPTILQSGVDQDGDGVDDACDGEYVKSFQDTSSEESPRSYASTGDGGNTSAKAPILLLGSDNFSATGDIDDLFVTQNSTNNFHFSDQTSIKTDLSSSKTEHDSDSQDRHVRNKTIMIIGIIVILAGVTGAIGFLIARRRGI